jgi:phosphonoacetaldehyde hydrolase
VVKVGDTISDIEEGLNAGTWAIGVSQTGNMIGLTEEDWHALPQPERESLLLDARRKFIDAGAHYVIDTLADLDQVLSQIEVRVGSGERP